MPDEAALELGHILFLDIVGYSKLLVDEQTSSAERLNKIVLDADATPAGDEMAVVYHR